VLRKRGTGSTSPNWGWGGKLKEEKGRHVELRPQRDAGAEKPNQIKKGEIEGRTENVFEGGENSGNHWRSLRNILSVEKGMDS